jgi:hypothetical protein
MIKMCIGLLHVKCPLLLPDFNETWIFYTFFEKYSNIKFHENSSNRIRVPWGQADGRTDMTKLIVVFRKFSNAPINMNFVKKNKQCVKQEIHSSSLKIETAGLSERLINFYQNTRRGVPVNSRHRSHCSENGSITDSKHSHSGIIWWHGQENFSSGGPPSLLVTGTGFFSGAKTAEVKREWSCTSVPPMFLHEVYRDNFRLISETVTLP